MQNHPSTTRFLKSVTFLGVFGILLSAAMVRPAHATGSHTPSCPLPARAGRTIVVFPKDDKIRSDKSFEESRSKMLPVELEVGSYKVTLVSFDSYPEREDITQPHESYFVRIFDEHEHTIADTNEISDLEDYTADARKTEMVNEKLVISKESTHVQAAHAVYPDTSSANSVIPVCAAFDRIEAPHIVASCSASEDWIKIGESVTWRANASGGTGNFTYAWSGNEGLSGTGKNVTKSYTSAGEKNATVVVTSGDKSVTRTCSTTVKTEEIATITGSCTAFPGRVEIDEEIEWQVQASGGTGSFTYAWTGTDGLSSTNKNVKKTYSREGEKSAIVVIISGDKTLTRTCSAVVEEEDVPELTGSCYADPSTVYKGDGIIWRTAVSGGTGTRTYSWTGTDNLLGSSQNLSRSYDSIGVKTATVVISSGDQNITRSCSINVQDRTVAGTTADTVLAACSVAPSTPTVNQRVVWTASASGGGTHSFAWTGNDGLSGTSANIEKTYATTGSKSATVVVTASNGQSVSKTCTVDVMAGVNLGNLPYTGENNMMPIALFIGGLLAASTGAGFFFVRRRDEEEVWDDARMNL
jgi:LPXTG-motif cell wall-anchored protein